MLAAVAAPFSVLIGLLAIFVPREFDYLSEKISNLSIVATESRDKAAQGAAEVKLVSEKIDGLVVSIARMDADRSAFQQIAFEKGIQTQIGKLAPSDVLNFLIESKII